jgi:hypothetical protein
MAAGSGESWILEEPGRHVMEQALGTAIGLGVTYLFLAVVVSALVEAISGLISLRATKLCEFITWLFRFGLKEQPAAKPGDRSDYQPGATSLESKFFGHPLIQTLGNAAGGRTERPSYIPAPIFVRAFLDAVAELQHKGAAIDAAYQQALATLPAEVQRQLKGIIGPAVSSLEGAEQRVTEWFNAAMDRLSGDYRRYVQRITRALAVVLVVGVNADSMSMGATFWRDPVAREAASQLARKALEQCEMQEAKTVERDRPVNPAAPVALPDAAAPVALPSAQPSRLDEDPPKPKLDCRELLEQTSMRLPLPLGWTSEAWCAMTGSLGGFLRAFFGLLLSVIAVSFGAPFWFDILRKIVPMLPLAGPKPKAKAAPKTDEE